MLLITLEYDDTILHQLYITSSTLPLIPKLPTIGGSRVIFHAFPLELVGTTGNPIVSGVLGGLRMILIYSYCQFGG